MNGSAYYAYQAKARGLNSPADVEIAWVRLMAPVYQRLLARWLPRDLDASIYEIACGPGIMLRYLREAGYTNATGSDSSDCQIKLARAAGLSVRLADSIDEISKAPAPAWDCLIAIDFIEHLPKDALIAFLGQAHRVIKREGCLILRAPNGDSPFVGRNLFNDITHYWAYTSVATEALLKMAGFQRVEFADESIAMLQRHRWLKVPLMKLGQNLLRRLVRMAIREDIHYFNPSLYICAWK